MTVVWDEAITLGIGGSRAALGVYAPNGKRVDSGNVQHPTGDTLTVALPHHLADGTYTVGWKVTSADTHVVSGAFTFSVGTRSGGAGVAEKLESSQQIPLALRDGFAVVRFLNLLLLLLCAGGAASIVFVQRDAAPAVRRRLWSIVAVCAIALAVVAVLGLPFEAAEQDGTGLLKGLEAKAIASVRGTRFGEIWLARAWLALIIAALAFSLERWSRARRAREILLLGAAVALALTPTASGHANVDGTLTFLVDALHVLSAAAWGGGLAFLAAGLAFDPAETAGRWRQRTVPRFSALALGSVAVLLAAGRGERLPRGPRVSRLRRLDLRRARARQDLDWRCHSWRSAHSTTASASRVCARAWARSPRTGNSRGRSVPSFVFVAIVGVTAVLIDEAPAKNVPAHPPDRSRAQTTSDRSRRRSGSRPPPRRKHHRRQGHQQPRRPARSRGGLGRRNVAKPFAGPAQLRRQGARRRTVPRQRRASWRSRAAGRSSWPYDRASSTSGSGPSRSRSATDRS